MVQLFSGSPRPRAGCLGVAAASVSPGFPSIVSSAWKKCATAMVTEAISAAAEGMDWLVVVVSESAIIPSSTVIQTRIVKARRVREA